MSTHPDPMDKAIRNLSICRTFRNGDREIQIACLVREADWRPLKAAWWRGKEVCVIGADLEGSADETFDATRDGNYPDAIVQILSLAGSPRAGDVILSAAPGWDFRKRYEPIPHRSSHGALHRDHMMVPLLLNRAAAGIPRRTTDLFASALDALGVAPPALMDGRSFL